MKSLIIALMIGAANVAFAATETNSVEVKVISANGIPAQNISVEMSAQQFDCISGSSYKYDGFSKIGDGIIELNVIGEYFSSNKNCPLESNGSDKELYFTANPIKVYYTVNNTRKVCYIDQNFGITGGDHKYLEAEIENKHIPCNGGDGISTYSINGGRDSFFNEKGYIEILGGI